LTFLRLAEALVYAAGHRLSSANDHFHLAIGLIEGSFLFKFRDRAFKQPEIHPLPRLPFLCSAPTPIAFLSVFFVSFLRQVGDPFGFSFTFQSFFRHADCG